jgi:hypothetical protein
MSILLKNNQNIKKIISNLIYLKHTPRNFSLLNSYLLNSNTEQNQKPREMDQLKDNPYFEKYKNKIKTVYE